VCFFYRPGRPPPDTAVRMLLEEHVVVLPCGEQTIRFRPTLDVTENDLAFGLAAFDRVLTALA
jgi:L-lysine 6-transaminase